MKFKSLENKAKKLNYKINEIKKEYVGSYDMRERIYIKRWIENNTKIMSWDASYYKDEVNPNLETGSVTINYKNDPDEEMTDYFTSDFPTTIKSAFKIFIN